jgi:hypothetical protein
MKDTVFVAITGAGVGGYEKYTLLEVTSECPLLLLV